MDASEGYPYDGTIEEKKQRRKLFFHILKRFALLKNLDESKVSIYLADEALVQKVQAFVEQKLTSPGFTKRDFKLFIDVEKRGDLNK